MNINFDTYYQRRENILEKIQRADHWKKLTMAVFMAIFTGITAQIIIPIPWSPVPITGQTFAVLVSGLILGKRWGALSQIIYILGGICGIAWFAEMNSGLNILFGSTGGYMIGFIFAAMFIGYFSEKYASSRKFKKMFIITSIANFICIYIPGLIVLNIWLYVNQGTFPDMMTLLTMGFFPFIIGDLFKIGGASFISKIFLPK